LKKHLQDLENVLTAYEEAGMTLKLSKCQFARPKVKFLGHMVGSGERTVVESKVQAILSIPEPTTKRALKSFLGMCSFYRSYIPHYAQIALPLTSLTKKRKSDKLQFNDRQKEAFIKLRQLYNTTRSRSNQAFHTLNRCTVLAIRIDISNKKLC